MVGTAVSCKHFAVCIFVCGQILPRAILPHYYRAMAKKASKKKAAAKKPAKKAAKK
jgi:hypothetical protein